MKLKCPVCISPFDDEAVRPLVGICGHSMCESCLRPGISCSICRKEDAFRFRTVNYQLIEVTSEYAENLRLHEETKKQLEDALARISLSTAVDESQKEHLYVDESCFLNELSPGLRKLAERYLKENDHSKLEVFMTLCYMTQKVKDKFEMWKNSRAGVLWNTKSRISEK